MKYKIKKEVLEEVIKECLSIAQVCRKLNIVPAGGNYKTLKFKIQEFNIDTSHFTGQGWNVGKRFKSFSKKRELKDILIIDSPHTNSNSLRLRLLDEGIKEYKCESCKLESWLDKKIPLEIHHKNGINNDHRIENIEILCPNCHAQTHYYRGRNINKES